MAEAVTEACVVHRSNRISEERKEGRILRAARFFTSKCEFNSLRPERQKGSFHRVDYVKPLAVLVEVVGVMKM